MKKPDPMSDGPACRDCRFWKRFDDPGSTNDGECFAMPPKGQFMNDADGDVIVMFCRPQTDSADRACAFWQAAN